MLVEARTETPGLLFFANEANIRAGSTLGYVDVRFAPESDRLLRCHEMTLCANTNQSAAQQLSRHICDLARVRYARCRGSILTLCPMRQFQPRICHREQSGSVLCGNERFLRKLYALHRVESEIRGRNIAG